MSLSSIITDLNTVATAYSSLNDFSYNEIHNVNEASNSFPMLLVNKRSLDFEVQTFSRLGLPNQTTLGLQLYFFNTYTELEKESTTLQAKQQELLDISLQFIAEIRKRYESTDYPFNITDVSYNVIDESHNERLIQISVNLTYMIKINDCTLGTFNY